MAIQTSPTPNKSLMSRPGTFQTAPTAADIAPVPYTSTGVQKLESMITNKPPLSTQDAIVKQNLVKQTSNNDVVHLGTTFRVDYVSGPDIFQVEILTTNIQRAKDDAMSWFASQGISKKGVCGLPVMFYLNHNVALQLQGTGIQLNPIPDGC